MSSPVRRKPRDVTTFPFLRSSGSAASSSILQPLSPIRRSSRRRAIFLLLLVLVLELRATKCRADGAAFERNRWRTVTEQDRVAAIGEFRPLDRKSNASGQSVGAETHRPTVDFFATRRPYHENSSGDAAAFQAKKSDEKIGKHEPIIQEEDTTPFPKRGKPNAILLDDDATFSRPRKSSREPKIGKREPIIQEKDATLIPKRGKPNAISLDDDATFSRTTRKSSREPNTAVSAASERWRLTRSTIGGSTSPPPRDSNSALNFPDNWNGSSGLSRESLNDGFEGSRVLSAEFSTTYESPVSANSVELDEKIVREAISERRTEIADYYGDDSNEDFESSQKLSVLYNPIATPLAPPNTSIGAKRKKTGKNVDSTFDAIFPRRSESNEDFEISRNLSVLHNPIATPLPPPNTSIGVKRKKPGKNVASTLAAIFPRRSESNEDFEISRNLSVLHNSIATPVPPPNTSIGTKRKKPGKNVASTLAAIFPSKVAQRSKSSADISNTDSALPTFAARRRLSRVKRIGGFVAPVLVTLSDENSSTDFADVHDKWNNSGSGVNDGVVTEKLPQKPPVAGPAATPVEKYDRRHFGPPRLENVEEAVVEATSEAAIGSSSVHSFDHFTAPPSLTPASSTSSFFSSTSPILPKLPEDSALDVNNTRGSVAAAAAEPSEPSEAAVDVSRVQATRGEEFPSDDKSKGGNEANVSAIDRLDDRVESATTTTTAAVDDVEQSSTGISKLFEPKRRKLATTEAASVITGPSGGSGGVDSEGRRREEVVDKLELTILGLFELTQGSEARPEGPSELQAARLAVDRINDVGALPNIRLRLIHNDTRCDPGVAVDRFFHALYTSKNTSVMPLLLGTACSEVTETLAKIVPYWNIVQVSFGSTAPALSDPTEFPLFVRTVAPDSSHNPARISLIKHFGWDTVTALSQNGDMYSLAVNDLVTELEQANITCTATITFGENDYKEQLRTLKELDTRIIIGSFSPDLAPRLFCEAWKLGMHGGDYAWILPGETIDLSGMTGDWWHSGPEDCTPSQLSQTLDGLIIVKSYGTGLAERPSYSGLTTSEFTSELAKRGVTLSRYAGQTYDAVWSMALALGKLEAFLNQRNSSIAQYSHSRKDMAYRLLEELKALNFLGVSGPVSFDGADRVGITAFYQMHGHVVRRVALYTPEDGRLTMNCAGCARTRWPGEHPPVARRVFRFRMVTIDYAAFLAVTCLASVGVTLALSFLAFNLHFRKHKSIKLSSPRLNNMAAVGCALVYGAVILLGLDHATLSDSNGYFPTICTARAYLLSAGFSLAFGSMFTKTYRVHRIFTRSRSGVVKNKLLQDTQLISLICVLLLIDGLVVTLWVTLDPMQRDLRNLTLEISSQDRAVIYQPQVEVCRSQHTNGWLAALYAYKGLLLIVGVYMAWETRHVKIPALNDSQYIGMSVYSVVITSGIVVVLANLMSDRATLAFVTITTLILASTTATLALLFLPQLANILAGERADPVVQSLGLKIECNTRRFVTDDSRELQYRVEVQNRVYRREMAQLELELARLEKQLGQEPVEPSHASSSASIPQRNPSIGGGLPLLLLSVLPPVIPRASWPSADPSGMRRGTVAFSSQPDLEPDEPRRSLADIYKLQWRRDTEGPSRLGVFQRLLSLFGSRPSSRKTSTASFTGVASALRVHMGYIAGLVPGTKASSSCQVNVQGIRQSHPRCGSGPIISITSDEDRRLSLGLRRKESSEPRVNFSLPSSKSAASQSSSRERIRGSPRFPHRIVPANSLSAIAPGSMTTAHQRWHSMEDASRQRQLFSSSITTTPRGSYAPSFDVWAFREKAIPLSEFDDRTGGRRKPPETLALTIPSDAKVSPDDGLLGSDLRKLFRENSATFVGSEEGSPMTTTSTTTTTTTPLESTAKFVKVVPSPRASPTKMIALIATSQTAAQNDSVREAQLSVGNESKLPQLSLSKSKVVVIRENNGHCAEPEFLLRAAAAASSELSTTDARTIDEESGVPCED